MANRREGLEVPGNELPELSVGITGCVVPNVYHCLQFLGVA